MFPTDAYTLQHTLNGPSSYTFRTSGTTRYILEVSMQQSGTASETYLFCGTSMIATNYGKDLPSIPLHYKCSDNIITNKTGNDNSSIVITLVDRDISQTPYNATISAEIKYDADTREGFYGFGLLMYTFMAIVILYVSIQLGLYIFKK